MIAPVHRELYSREVKAPVRLTSNVQDMSSPVAVVKPLNEKETRPRPRSTSVEDKPERQKLDVTCILDLTPNDVLLLIISRFASKNNTDTCKISTKETAGKVVIMSTSEKEVNEMKANIHSHLQTVEKTRRSFDRWICQYLLQGEPSKCLRGKFKHEKINAVISVDEKTCTVTCMAFFTQQIERAFQYLDDNITQRSIDLRPNQTDIQFTSARGLVGVFKEDMKVHIVSFFDKNCKDIFDKVLAELAELKSASKHLANEEKKTKVPAVPDRKEAKVVLHNGMARFYRRFCHPDLEQRLRYEF